MASGLDIGEYEYELERVVSRGLKALNIEISPETYEKLALFTSILVESNKKFNLTAITDPQEIAIKHHIDSLSLLQLSPLLKSKRIIDVGTGAGFPGIPLAMVMRDSRFILLDALLKRIRFIESASEELGLDNVDAVHGRAEDYANDQNVRESFDCVVSRAVADLSILSEYCLPFARVGGYFLAMKGPEIDEEISRGKRAISILGGEIVEVVNFTINDDTRRSVVVVRKNISTSGKYPRKAGKPKKHPLGY